MVRHLFAYDGILNENTSLLFSCFLADDGIVPSTNEYAPCRFVLIDDRRSERPPSPGERRVTLRSPEESERERERRLIASDVDLFSE